MSKQLDRLNRKLDRKVTPFERAIMRWMVRYSRELIRDEIESNLGKVSKAKGGDDNKELRELLMRYGVVAAQDGAHHAAAQTVGLQRIIDPKALQDQLKQKQFKLKLFQELNGNVYTRAQDIAASTKKLLREAVAKVIQDAANEEPKPSAGEISKRINELVSHKDPNQRTYAFSPTRAMTIARTELTQAFNTGHFATYKVAGVKKIEWIAYRDGKSKERHHERMDGVVIEVGKLFTTPLGNKLRFPGDPSAPIADTAQCRCTSVAVID